MKRRDWEKIYITIMDQEYLTIDDIRLIANVGSVNARKIRNTIRESQLKKDEPLPNEQTPTELLLKYLGKSRNYYKNNCFEQLEMKAIKRRGESNGG